MVIVDIDQIPTEISDVPMDDPIRVYKVCQELESLCLQNNGIGISAVQAGIPWRLFLVKGDGTCPMIPKGKFGYFVNCDYKNTTEERVVSLEGCLSIRSTDGQLRSFQVERYLMVNLFGYRLLLNTNDMKFEEINYSLSVLQQGVVFQHEADHSYGQERLISKIGKEIFIW